MARDGKSSKGERDMISSLPDCLIHLIMSFLTAQEAVRTCVLSKRWKDLWTTLPFLYFDFCEFMYDGCDQQDDSESEPQKGLDKFRDFITMTLLLRKASDLHTLRLLCGHFNEHWEYHMFVRSWIQYALKHNLRVLNIKFYLMDSLPLGVFTCASLVEALMGFDITLPSMEVINLPCLRRLHLFSMTLQQDFVDKLFAGCPVLEYLHLEDCCREFSTINSQSLTYLEVDKCCVGGKGMELINTPKLLSLSYAICPYSNGHKVLLKMPSLTSASIDISRFCFEQSYKGKSNILIGISNVQHLVLSGDGIKDLLKTELPNCPEFSNLKDLSVESHCLNNYYDLLASFLNYCPNLEKLSLFDRKSVYDCPDSGCYCEEKVGGNKEPLKISPYMGKRLKTVEVKFIRSDKNFSQAVKYIQDITENSRAQINMTSLEY